MSTTAQILQNQPPLNSSPTPKQTSPGEVEYRFEVPDEFTVFGRWIDSPVHIAGEDATESLANWLAHNESPAKTDDELWQACVENNLPSFSTLRTMELFDSSLDLPKGNVVFSSVEDPAWIKDDPPGPILDRLAAVRLRFPAAKIWVHEPVYHRPKTDEEAPVLLTHEGLLEEARRANAPVWSMFHKQRERNRLKIHFRRVFEFIRARWHSYRRYVAVSEKAMQLRTATMRQRENENLIELISEAKTLGLRKEADYMQMTRYGSEGMSVKSIERAEAFEKENPGTFASELERFVHVVMSSQFSAAAFAALSTVGVSLAVVTIASALIPSVVVIDPILTFTTPENEDRHWFIGHWDWKPTPDGSKSLVYI